MRPPNERPPMAMRPIGTPSRSASAVVATRTVSMHTAGGSVRRLPAACPGNSTRSTARPVRVTASSIATSPDCVRRALAPGVSTSPAMPAVAMAPSWRARAAGAAASVAAVDLGEVLLLDPFGQESGLERMPGQLGEIGPAEIERLGHGAEVVGDVPAEVGGIVGVDSHQQAPLRARTGQVVLCSGTGRRRSLTLDNGHTVSGICSATSRVDEPLVLEAAHAVVDPPAPAARSSACQM